MPCKPTWLALRLSVLLLLFVASGARAYQREPRLDGLEVPRTDPAGVRSLPGQWQLTRDDQRWDAFRARNGDAWRVRWNEATRTAHRVFGSRLAADAVAPGVRPAGRHDKDAILRLAAAFVRAESDLLGARWEDLRPVFAAFRGGRWVVTLQQQARGLEVVGGRVDLRFTADGDLILFGSDVYPVSDNQTLPRLDAARVAEAACAGLQAQTTVQGEPVLVQLPMLADEPLPPGVTRKAAPRQPIGPSELRVRLAYRTHVRSLDPPADWVTYVDAATGQVLWRYNRLRYASVSGTVTADVHPVQGTDPTVSMAFPDAQVFGGVSTGAVATYNFEGGAAGWVGQAPWAISSESVHGGTKAWSDSPGVQYANNRNITLTSPTLNIAAVTDPVLEFWARTATEFEYDFLYAEASADNGTTWKTLRAISGTTAWHLESVDLAPVQGTSTLKVRFRFFTDEAVVGDGCWIDDVSVGSRGSDVTSAAGQYALATTGGSNALSVPLRGRYVDVYKADNTSSTLSGTSGGGTLNFNWTSGNSLASERDMYWAVQVAHSRIKQIDPAFNGLDYPLPIYVNTANYCNAFWGGSAIVMGAGTGATCADLGTWQAVMYHEYGHGITDFVYSPVSDPPGDMHEGFSDYYASTITGDPRVGQDIQGPGTMFRTIDNRLRDPEDRGGEVHFDGTIIAGALWDMRKLLLPDVALADSLFQFARYGFPYNYEDYFLEVLTVDDNDGNLANGTPHLPQIRSAFGYHGIGYGPEFKHVAVVVQDAASGNGDGRLDPGESAGLLVSVRNYGGAETGVYAKLSSATPGVTVTQDSVWLGNLGAGGEVTLPASFAVTVAGSVPVGTMLVFDLGLHSSVGANGDGFQLPVGYVPILLVDDDRFATFETYYQDSLGRLGKGFTRWVAGSLASPTAEEMAKYRAVIWLTGNDKYGSIQPGDQAELAAYLAGGGKLWVTGEGIAEDLWSGYNGYEPTHADSLFYRVTLHARANLASENLTAGTPSAALAGEPGDPVAAGLSFTLQGGTGADNQASASSLLLEVGAAASIRYSSSRIAALRYTAGSQRLLYTGFGFEGVTTQAQRDTLMAHALRWLCPAETTPPAVAVVQPNGGEHLIGASPCTVRWTAQDSVAVLSVNILLSTNGGASYTPVATGIPNSFSYIWTVTDVSSSDCRLRVEAVDPSGNVGSDASDQSFRITATTDVASLERPARFALHPAVPNPFNPSTRLLFDLPRDSQVWLEILSVDGRRVRAILTGQRLAAGWLERAWDGRDDAGTPAATGVYLARMRTEGFAATRKIQLVK